MAPVPLHASGRLFSIYMSDLYDELSDAIDEAFEEAPTVFQLSIIGGNFKGVLSLGMGRYSMQTVGTVSDRTATLVCGKKQFDGERVSYPCSVYIDDQEWTLTDLDEDAGSYRMTVTKATSDSMY